MFQEVDDRGGQGALGAELLFEGVQLGLVRQAVVVEQEDDFLVAAVRDEIIDMVSDVAEFTDITDDVAEGGFVGDDPFEAACVF